MQLRSGDTRSCGCFWEEIVSEINTKHGYYKHPLYGIWNNVKSRCSNKNNKDYKDYGGRGITICDEWKGGPKSFIEWSENNGWKKGLYIDRKNNDGNYCPSNCRFVTSFINSQNTRLLQRNNTSGYRGVSWRGRDKKWAFEIGINGERRYLGSFDSKKLSAIRYDVEVISNNLAMPTNFN